MASKMKGMTTEQRMIFRSERATNAVIRSLNVIARRGKGLSETHKAAVLAAITKAFGEAEKELKKTPEQAVKAKAFSLVPAK